VSANLGEPSHRWLNALEKYSGKQAVMDLNIASGGLLDAPTKITKVNGGAITLDFDDCARRSRKRNPFHRTE